MQSKDSSHCVVWTGNKKLNYSILLSPVEFYNTFYFHFGNILEHLVIIFGVLL